MANLKITITVCVVEVSGKGQLLTPTVLLIILGLDTETKTQIRTTLTSLLLERHAQLLYFVKNKLAKLIVDVGRHDWPHFYPDFMDNIFSLIQTPSTSLLGLVLLQVRLRHGLD